MSRCCAPSARALGTPATAESHLAAREAGGGAKDPPSALPPASDAATHWIEIAGGNTRIGSNDPEGFASDGEGPARSIMLSPYRISATTVTNAQFAAFIEATGYRTEAEQAGESFVFYLQIAPDRRATLHRVVSEIPWWIIAPGASWQCPHGPGSSWRQLPDHPVVQVSWNDAMAYCRWRGTSLPAEAQWEHAARGSPTALRYPWGDELEPQGERRCNIWQGSFSNAPLAGWQPGTVPAHAFSSNGLGLYNTSGNVWEWCADWFNADYHRKTSDHDPLDERPSGRRSQRGGSFLCHVSYCNRYRNAARGANSPNSATSHTGFRVVSAAGRV